VVDGRGFGRDRLPGVDQNGAGWPGERPRALLIAGQILPPSLDNAAIGETLARGFQVEDADDGETVRWFGRHGDAAYWRLRQNNGNKKV
jgi:hypothetical protein